MPSPRRCPNCLRADGTLWTKSANTAAARTRCDDVTFAQ